MSVAAAPTCPYCGLTLHPVVTVPAPFQPATTRECTFGFLLGLVVVAFVDVGIFARRDPTTGGFLSNLAIAAVLTTLLVLWYRQMRCEVGVRNREAYRMWEQQTDAAMHLYRCGRCALSFRR